MKFPAPLAKAFSFFPSLQKNEVVTRRLDPLLDVWLPSGILAGEIHDKRHSGKLGVVLEGAYGVAQVGSGARMLRRGGPRLAAISFAGLGAALAAQAVFEYRDTDDSKPSS